MPIQTGLTDAKKEVPFRVTPDGAVVTAAGEGQADGTADVLLELRAIRVGLELLNRLPPGELLNYAHRA